MQRHYGPSGLACMSVSMDVVSHVPKTLAFLKTQGAAFDNYLLDEKDTFWQEKFDINGPPAVFVFDREGKRAGKFDKSDPEKTYSYADVEILVRKLLSAR